MMNEEPMPRFLRDVQIPTSCVGYFSERVSWYVTRSTLPGKNFGTGRLETQLLICSASRVERRFVFKACGVKACGIDGGAAVAAEEDAAEANEARDAPMAADAGVRRQLFSFIIIKGEKCSERNKKYLL